jgi:chromosome segregation ATPase
MPGTMKPPGCIFAQIKLNLTMKVLYLTIFLPAFFLCCKQAATQGDSSSTEAKALEAKVMTLHDEVMPKVNDISALSAQLRKLKASLPESVDGQKEIPDGLDQILESLKLSEQGMWDWMKAYSDAKATLTEDQVKPFMEKQLDILNKVDKDMTTSIEQAKNWIAAHPAQ